MGLIGTVVAIGSMAGPVTGGVLIENIGWRSMFYINIPVGIIGVATAFSALRKDEITKGQIFDIAGALAPLSGIHILSLQLYA